MLKKCRKRESPLSKKRKASLACSTLFNTQSSERTVAGGYHFPSSQRVSSAKRHRNLQTFSSSMFSSKYSGTGSSSNRSVLFLAQDRKLFTAHLVFGVVGITPFAAVSRHSSLIGSAKLLVTSESGCLRLSFSESLGLFSDCRAAC